MRFSKRSKMQFEKWLEKIKRKNTRKKKKNTQKKRKKTQK